MAIPSTTTLRALEAAARLESYSGAARQLNLTHGAVSRRLRDLEAQQGQPLFERMGNTMRPTVEGLRLADVARRALATIEAGFEAKLTAPSTRSKRKSLRISCVPALATRFLSARLSSFLETHRDFEVTLLPQSELVDFDNARIDAAIRYGRGPWRGVAQTKLEAHDLVAVRAPNLRGNIETVPLLRHSWRSWTPWLQTYNVSRSEPKEGRLFDESDLLLRSALLGEGMALVAEPFARDDLETGKLVEPYQKRMKDINRFHLVWKECSASPELEIFGNWLTAELSVPVAE